MRDLPDQIDGPVAKFTADGTCGGAAPGDLLETRFGGIVEAVIPPPNAGVQSPQSALLLPARDRPIAEIDSKGRMAWQTSTGYNQRSRVETQIGRWETVIGPKLKARNFHNQKIEAKIGSRSQPEN